MGKDDFFKLCASGGRERIPEAFRKGAAVDERDSEGMTPLMFAAFSNENVEVIAFLIKAGADAGMKDNTGKSSFAHAQKNGALQGTEACRSLREVRHRKRRSDAEAPVALRGA